MPKPKNHSSAFKAKVALGALTVRVAGFDGWCWVAIPHKVPGFALSDILHQMRAQRDQAFPTNLPC